MKKIYVVVNGGDVSPLVYEFTLNVVASTNFVPPSTLIELITWAVSINFVGVEYELNLPTIEYDQNALVG